MARKRIWVLFLLIGAVISLQFGCKPVTYYLGQVYKVHGRVTVAGSEGKTPIGSAEVFVGDYQYSELTNYYGDYEIELSEGTWTLNIVKDGYEPFSATVAVGPDAPRVQLDAELVWIPPVVPIDLTGDWDFTLFPDNAAQMGPFTFLIKQTSTDLFGTSGQPDYTFTGTIDGSMVTIDFATGTLTGTCSGSGDEISGSFNLAGFGTGTFLFTRSTATFGSLSFSGTCAGQTVSVDTSRAVLMKETHVWQNTSFGVLLDTTQADIFMFGKPLSAGDYVVVEGDVNDTGELGVSCSTGPGQGMDASSGTVRITQYGSSNMSGSYELYFPDGSYLSGTFDLVFGNLGTSTVSGTWQGTTLPEREMNAVSGTETRTTSYVALNYWDETVNSWVWFNVDGYPSVGTYTIPDAAWGTFRWEPVGGVPIGEVDYVSGVLNFTQYDQYGCAANFQISFEGGGTIIGSFDVPFGTSAP
jgi:hypothetical protein